MVNNVANVKLYYCYANRRDALQNTLSINNQLIKRGLAQKTEEPFLSKVYYFILLIVCKKVTSLNDDRILLFFVVARSRRKKNAS